MKSLCEKALEIYRDTLYCGETDLSKTINYYFDHQANVVGNLGSSFGQDDCFLHARIFLHAFPSLIIQEAEAFRTKNQGIVIPWKVGATHYGDFLGIAPTQKKIQYHGYTSLFLTADNKVQKWDYRIDVSEITQQLGQTAEYSFNRKKSLVEHLQKMGTDKTILTLKQTECLAYLCQGLSSKYIASYLKISYKTVECHTQAIKEKLGCIHKEQLIDVIRAKGMYYSFRELFDWLFSGAS